MTTLILEWLTPQGVIALGVLWGLAQQFITSRRTARAVKVLAVSTAGAAAAAAEASEKITAVAMAVEEVKIQTNGMSHRLETLAGEAGEARGRAEGKAEEKK